MITVNEAIDFIYESYLKAERYQDFNAPDSQKRNPSLTRELLRAEEKPAVLVTGSKGKGSVAIMISEMLQTKYSVGLFTGPHVIRFQERFRVNDREIPDDDFCRITEKIKPQFDEIQAGLQPHQFVSPMGIQAVIAQRFFSEQNTDIDVYECGKGVQYDDVRNIRHEYAVINTIFPEHLRELGGSIEEIAKDKSYIIEDGVKCVYVAEQCESVMRILEERAAKYNVPMKKFGADFDYENVRFTTNGMKFDLIIGTKRYEEIEIPVMGEHQAKNCALAMCVASDILSEFDIPAVKAKLRKLSCPGRMEVLSDKPFILLDACIHRENCKYVKEVLHHLGIKEAEIIIGLPDDKDYLGVAQEMWEFTDFIILTKSSSPHYRFSSGQAAMLAIEGIPAICSVDVKEAIKQARTRGRFTKPIVILGTTSLIADVEMLFQDLKKKSSGH